jgi:hypothetical protein
VLPVYRVPYHEMGCGRATLIRERRDFSACIRLRIHYWEASGVLIHVLEQERSKAPISVINVLDFRDSNELPGT